MDWWIWVILGLALLAVEMATPGSFYFLFFGAAALIVGVLAGFDAVGPSWVQWLVFSILSIASLLLLRGPLQARLLRTPGAGDIDSLIGESAILLEDLAVGGIARAELHGTSWTARNAGDGPLAAGCRCRVERVQGLTLWLRAE